MYNSACEAHCRYGAGVVVLTWLRQTSSLDAGAPPPIAPAEQIPVRGQTEKMSPDISIKLIICHFSVLQLLVKDVDIYIFKAISLYCIIKFIKLPTVTHKKVGSDLSPFFSKR